MRLFSGQVSIIAEEMLRALIRHEDLEVNNELEVQLDIESVLREFIRVDREITEQARDLSAQSGGQIPIGRIKRQLAKEKRVRIGDESIGYIVDQLIETFLHSNFVDEVWAEDTTLRGRLKPILSKHMEIEQQLDSEVRNKIKNIKEGGQTWDIEYQRVMENLKRKKNL